MVGSRWSLRIRPGLRRRPHPWFPSPLNIRMKHSLSAFRAFITKLIERRVKEAHNGTVAKKDLLSILLFCAKGEDDNPMTVGQVIDEVLGMIVGGHETSASALTWFWYEVGKRPEVYSKLRQEVEDVLKGDCLTLEAISELKYLRMVLDEVLRLYPPFWFENRGVMEDTELAGIKITKGSIIAMSRFSLHSHPGYWKRPLEFIPERHDPDSPENLASSFACVPFSGGPRTCIGLHFARLEMMVIIASILARFKLKTFSASNGQASANLTLTLKGGLKGKI